MTQYRSDSISAIQELFTKEGDALERAGRSMPNMAGEPEEHIKYIARTALTDEQPEVING